MRTTSLFPTWLLAGLLVLGSLGARAQYRPGAAPAPGFSAPAAHHPLANALTASGRLQPGASGSFDATGYHMTPDPTTGQPTFQANRPAAAGDENWQDGFGLAGTNGNVTAVAVSGTDVYVGGDFTAAGTVVASRIARWDGSTWHALGAGVNSTVYALAVQGTNLYAGGYFTTAGGAPANHVARWDGSAWHPVGGGTDQPVFKLALLGTDLYATGAFSTAGGVPANHVARWNGNAWSALGAGLNANGNTLLAVGPDLYVGGQFTEAGGAPASYLARWDGSAWHEVGGGVDSEVYALATDATGTNLYVGGNFATAGNTPAAYVACWDGSAWTALGDGFDRAVFSLAVVGSTVYAGGFMQNSGSTPLNYIAQWNGNAWSALDEGVAAIVFTMTSAGTHLYVGSGVSSSGPGLSGSIARWTGSAWQQLSEGLDGQVFAVVVQGADTYVGGSFRRINGLIVNHIARWDGAAWHPVGTGFDGDVWALAVWGGDLYAGGLFTEAGGVAAQHLARWNGTAWSAVGGGVSGGLDGGVNALAVAGPHLYVGGDFALAGAVPANSLARWNGTTWNALGTGLGAGSLVTSLAVTGTDVYAGGYFSEADGGPGNFIARWTGTTWQRLGNGVSAPVSALAVAGTQVYVGGKFSNSNGAHYIARWDGTAWHPLGAGVDNYVASLATSGTDVYVGGSFSTAGGVARPCLARWDGAAWQSVGSGLNGYVAALTVAGNHMLAGGGFSTTADTSKVIGSFGLYSLSPAPVDLTISTAAPVPAGTYRNLTVTATGVATLTGPVQVTGALVVQTGGSLATACQPLTGAGSFALAAGATLRICEAAGISTSGATGAVQVAGTRSFSTDATYVYDGSGAQLTGTGLPATARELEIANAAGVTLTQAASVTRVLRLSSGVCSTGGQALTLRSTAGRTAYAVHGGGSASGNVTVQRFITGPARPSYHHLSSPVQSTTVADLATAGFTPIVNAAYNALPVPALPAAGYPNVFYFDEARGGAGNADFTTAYASPGALTDGLAAGSGYATYLRGGLTPDFVGALRSGPLTVGPLSRTGNVGTNAKAGWHLLGNPYPQPLDWNLATVPPTLNPTIYAWFSQGGLAGSYRFYNPATGTGTLAGGRLAVGQAFLIRTRPASSLAGERAAPITFTFTDALRVEDGTVPLGRAAVAAPTLRLNLAQAGAPADEADATFLTFAPTAATALDDFDALRPARNVGVPTLATVVAGQEAALNVLPTAALASGLPTVVELTATLPTAGTYTLSVGALTGFDLTPVALLDRLTATRYDLRQQPVLTFATATANQTLAGRFAVVLGGSAAPLGTTAAAAPMALTVWPNPAGAGAVVRVGGLAPLSAFVLTDLTGRPVLTGQADAAGAAALPTAPLAAGLYMVRTPDGRTARLLLK